MRFGSVLFLVALLLLCGCTSDGVPEAPRLDMAAYGQPAPATLPALDRLDAMRAGSDLVETLIGGKFTLSRSAGAQEQGTALLLDATATGPGLGEVTEWAIYAFNPSAVGGSLDSLRMQFDVLTGSGAWIGLADYYGNRWELSGPWTSFKTFSLDDPRYLSPGGMLYVSVLSDKGSSIIVNALSVRRIDPDNLPPTADLQASVSSGNVPLNVDFDATASLDPDGSIIEYAWDWNGDGGFDTITETATFSHLFTSPGVFDVTLRVTDDELERANAVLQVTVSLLGNNSPVASLQADVTTGTAPLTVEFDASASSDGGDAGDSIVRFDWDFNGDGMYESYDAPAQLQHSYTSGGNFNAIVRVTDSVGSQDTASLAVDINSPPLPVLQMLPNKVARNENFELEASASTDPDGSITKYEWDTDGNGSFETDSASDSKIEAFAPSSLGLYVLKLRVTDDAGATATDTALLYVSGWTLTTLDTAAVVGDHKSLAIVTGNPAVSYYNNNLIYLRASDSQGLAWNSPVTVDSTGGSGQFSSLSVVNGSPAISYYKTGVGDLLYVRADDIDGTSWGATVTVDATGNTGFYTSLSIVNGRPAIAYFDNSNGDLRYVRANDADGSAWATPVTPDSAGTTGQRPSLAVISGSPAISYYDATNGDLRYVRSNDLDGNAWSAPVTIYTPADTGRYSSLAFINGRPAIAWSHGTPDDLCYARASDSDGTAWPAPTLVDTLGQTGNFPSLTVIGARPAISYQNYDNKDLCYVRALDISGDTWGTPLILDSAGSQGWNTSMVELSSGRPAICYYESALNDLRYASEF